MQNVFTSMDNRQQLSTKIVQVAMSAFQTKGIKAVKMDDLASSLGISKRTLYELFDNKEELLLECVKQENQNFRSHMDHLKKNKDASTLSLLLETYHMQMEYISKVSPYFYTDIQKYPKVREWVAIHKKENDKEAELFFQEGIKQGFFRDDFDYSLLGQIAEATREHIMKAQLFKTYGMKKIFHDVVLLYIRGLCTQKGIEIIDKSL